MCRSEVEERTPLLTPEEVVDRIFQLVDENGDGKELMAQIAFMHNVKLSLLDRLVLIMFIKKSLRMIALLRQVGFGSGLFMVRAESSLVQQEEISYFNVKYHCSVCMLHHHCSLRAHSSHRVHPSL